MNPTSKEEVAFPSLKQIARKSKKISILEQQAHLASLITIDDTAVF